MKQLIKVTADLRFAVVEFCNDYNGCVQDSLFAFMSDAEVYAMTQSLHCPSPFGIVNKFGILALCIGGEQIQYDSEMLNDLVIVEEV